MSDTVELSGFKRRCGTVTTVAAVVAAGLTWLGGGLATAAPVTSTLSYTGPAVPIPEAGDLSGTNPGAVANAFVTASGLLGEVTDVDLRIDGSACSATAGSTTVGIDHTFINDLVITLTSPSGTSVNLIENTDGGGNNLCQTYLDDESVGAGIQTVATASAPFTGSFTPSNALSAFDGEDPNGNWTLSAQDFFSSDIGNLRAFTVILTTAEIGDVTATKTVSGAYEEGGTVTYTVTCTNDGNATVADNPGNEFTDVLPAGLTLVSASATAGTATATVGTNTVTWNGSLAATESITITITATVNAGTQNSTISNQGTVSFDSDIDGTNDTSRQTDDPGPGGSTDPTSFAVVNASAHVSVEQAAGQADPSTDGTVHFTVTFSEAVTGFDAADIVLSGTAGATTAVVTGTGPVYDVAVSGMTQPGSIIVTVAAGAAKDGNDLDSAASTSVDNVVSFGTAGPPFSGFGAGASVSVSFWLGLALLMVGGTLVFAAGRRRTLH
ncbi:MAG: proprotein convertase P-domain-containing protein [Actinomycetota bacterium]|nr:proprotein convertase P-domain-containing protein [Actinomycetota bacterium]